MHLFLLLEAYPEELTKWIDWIRSRKYDIASRQAQWGVKVREFKFLDLVFPEEWKDELLKDIRLNFKSDDRFALIQNNIFAKKMMKKVGIEPVDLEALKNTPVKVSSEWGKEKQQFCGGYTYPIGFLPDGHFDGKNSNPYLVKGLERM